MNSNVNDRINFEQVICSAVSLLACVPLGELFFFHMILIRKVSSRENSHTRFS